MKKDFIKMLKLINTMTETKYEILLEAWEENDLLWDRAIDEFRLAEDGREEPDYSNYAKADEELTYMMGVLDDIMKLIKPYIEEE